MTIEQTVEIPASHQLTLDIPTERLWRMERQSLDKPF
jgi:hypothetical protein